MKTKYEIKNFRVFGNAGASIEFEPITILTGCNSSGKSSIVKSLMLADSFLKRVKEDYAEGKKVNLSTYKLDFTQYPNNLLGRFSSIVNHESENGEVGFSFTNYSRMLGVEVKNELIFASDNNDSLDNGYLKSIKLYIDEEVIYSSDKENGTWININLILDKFLDFVQIQSLYSNILGVESEYEFSDRISEDEYKRQFENMRAAIKPFPKNREQDVIGYCRYGKSKEIISLDVLKQGLLDSIIETGSMFFVPMFETLSSLSKDEQIAMLNTYIQREKDEDIKHIYKRMIDAFEESSFASIMEYFLDAEKSWREKVDITPNPLAMREGPMVFSNGYIKLFKGHFLSSPKNTIGILGDDGKFIPSSKDEDKMQEWLNVELTFPIIYEIIMRINTLSQDGKEDSIHYKFHDGRYDFMHGYVHKVLYYLSVFFADFMEEILSPDWVGNINFVSSSRVDIRRIYDIQNDTDFAKLLRNYFEYGRIYRNYQQNYYGVDKRNYEPDSFMNKWVKKFGIGEEIRIITDEDGAGVKIRLYKADGTSSLLADEGYGITQLMSILVQIECAIQSAEKVKVNNLWNQGKFDGYDDTKFHYAEQTIAIEEPEIHLHPKYQSLLADMFEEAMTEYNIHFIIETHSEYLLRRTQYMVASAHYKNEEDLKEKCPLKVYYIPENGTAYDMQYQINGKFTQSFGEGFFDEADKWVMKMYELEED